MTTQPQRRMEQAVGGHLACVLYRTYIYITRCPSTAVLSSPFCGHDAHVRDWRTSCDIVS